MIDGERIRECRKDAGITQKELGNKLGVSQQQIAQYEKGSRIPKIEMLKKISDALGVSVADLIGDMCQDKAKWILTSSTYHCSKCKNEAYWDTDYGQQLFNYCPYCGAKMKGT